MRIFTQKLAEKGICITINDGDGESADACYYLCPCCDSRISDKYNVSAAVTAAVESAADTELLSELYPPVLEHFTRSVELSNGEFIMCLNCFYIFKISGLYYKFPSVYKADILNKSIVLLGELRTFINSFETMEIDDSRNYCTSE